MPQPNDADHSADTTLATAPATPRVHPARRPPGRAADRSFSLILCAGMPRAGSTLQYNLVRLLAERFLEARAGGWAQSYDDFTARFPECSRRAGAPRKPLVLKAHEFDARFAALIDPPPRRASGEPCGHVFYVYRDVRDALVSYTRQFGGSLDENIERWTARWIEWAEHWCGLINVTISRYETLMHDPHGELLRYARALGIHATNAEIDDILATCSAEHMHERSDAIDTDDSRNYDAEYLVHPDHLGHGTWGQWRAEITIEQRDAVWRAAGLWLDEHGYPRHAPPSDEKVLAEIAATPATDLAPPGVPQMRLREDPLVGAFSSALSAPPRRQEPSVSLRPMTARTFYGDELRVLPDELVSNKLRVTGYFEEGLTWALLQCLRPGDTFIDVGAHIGYFTKLAASLVGPEGRVETFEPTPRTAELLRANVKDLPQIGVNELAAFDKTGPLTFHDLGDRYAAYNSVLAPRLEGGGGLKQSHKLTVQAVTLDEFCGERHLRPSFIKIDAESAELNVLKGAAVLLTEAQPIVSIEVGDVGVSAAASSCEVVRFAIDKGYRPYEYKRFGQFAPHELRRRYAYDNLLLLPQPFCRPRDGGEWSNKWQTWLTCRAIDRQAVTIANLRTGQARLRAQMTAWRRQAHALRAQLRHQQHSAATLHRSFARNAWQALGQRFDTVALFGAGRFTRWLLSAVGDVPGGPRIIRVFDDAATPGAQIESIPIVTPDPTNMGALDAIVIGTDVPDSMLHARCAELGGDSLPVVNLYKDLNTGPFPTDMWISP